MTVAPPSKPGTRLSEAYTFAPSPLRVNREAGVIHGVKVLGFNSSNNRRYTKEGVAKAVKAGLYEGAKVFVDHPARSGEMRPAADLLGRLHNARLGEDGVYADLHANTQHPMWPRVAEDCEKGLGLYGLSHNAEAGDYHFDRGVQVVPEISRVESVDLVSSPATNKNLWEGAKVPIPLKQWLEERTTDRTLPAAVRRRIFEMAAEVGTFGEQDEPMMADEPAAVDGRQLLAQAVAALMQSGDAGDHDLATKVMRLLKPAPAAEAEEDPDVENGKAEESRRPAGKAPPAAAVLTESDARDLCALADVPATAPLLDALSGLTETQARKTVLAQKQLAASVRRGTGPPRSASGHGEAAHGDKVPATRQAALDWLKE